MIDTAHKSLTVNVSQMKRVGDTKREEIQISMPQLKVIDTVLLPEEKVEVGVLLERIEGGIAAHGTVRAGWQAPCRRCLKDVNGRLNIDVRDLFTAQPDETSYELKHDQVDLEPMVRDAVLLELPQAPLCKEDCKGLCPVCGIDRNLEDCSCVIVEPDERWSALDALKEDE